MDRACDWIEGNNKYLKTAVETPILLLLSLSLSSLSQSIVTGLFSPALPLTHQWPPPLTLQVSHCSAFRNVCAVPSTAVCCSESIECFPGIAYRFFLKLSVTIPVAPIITGPTVHFRFYIRYISICNLLYFKLLLLLLLVKILSPLSTVFTHIFHR
jgi:hypothetical protein